MYFTEKEDDCPRCGKALSQIEYDTQRCDACKTGMDFMVKNVDSASDERTVNNTFRHQYRVLSDDEKAVMVALKDKGQEFLDLTMSSLPPGRERALAQTKIEEAVMWAVKALTN